jgi:hypothetical protein
MSTLIPVAAWAAARNLSARQGQVYRSAGRLPGAVETPKGWLVPSDVEPLPAMSRDVVPVSQPATSPDVVPMSRALPAGLWPLDVVARYWDTSVPRIELMGERGLLVIGPFGPLGGLRVYVAG